VVLDERAVALAAAELAALAVERAVRAACAGVRGAATEALATFRASAILLPRDAHSVHRAAATVYEAPFGRRAVRIRGRRALAVFLATCTFRRAVRTRGADLGRRPTVLPRVRAAPLRLTSDGTAAVVGARRHATSAAVGAAAVILAFELAAVGTPFLATHGSDPEQNETETGLTPGHAPHSSIASSQRAPVLSYYEGGMANENETRHPYDVVIVGGGPAGLSAALALGRARKRVLVCDSGPRRNLAAERIHNFVTRDGTPPDQFRQIARQQLQSYPSVEVGDVRVASISGRRGAFRMDLTSETVGARRVLLATGMVDEMLPIDGFRELWGRSIFQCPYCHGWEEQDRRWAYLAPNAERLPFALKLRGWTRDVVFLTGGAFEVADAMRAQLAAAGIRLETQPVVRLTAHASRLVSIELAGGDSVPCEVLFAHPPQQQVELVRALGVELDDHRFVQVDPMTRETSIPGVYAAGDLTTSTQGAILAAASGTQAAAMINAELTAELASTGVL
jgi:thioredoxin reductase